MTAPHIQQNPVYRTDQFVCSTYVSQVLALIQAHNIQQYEKNLVSIKYGAAQKPASLISYYNRNNFVSSDFNRVNEKNGMLSNSMLDKRFQKVTRTISTTIDHDAWFGYKQRPDFLYKNIHVFNKKTGKEMLRRFNGNYPAPFHAFKPTPIVFSYIPKKTLFHVIKSQNGTHYLPNQALFNKLPTPAVLEIARDDKQWKIKNKSIRKILHSGIAVSHLGLLYRAHYKYHQFIYPQITCNDRANQTSCQVKSQFCQNKHGCDELMFSHATDAFPNHYYFYEKNAGHYACSKKIPDIKNKSHILYCNRVVSMPLQDYFTAKKDGKYSYMNNPSILGIHLEKIHIISLWKKFK